MNSQYLQLNVSIPRFLWDNKFLYRRQNKCTCDKEIISQYKITREAAVYWKLSVRSEENVGITTYI